MPDDKLLIISSGQDQSLELIKKASSGCQFRPLIRYYSDPDWQLSKLLDDTYFRALYLRDPFNDPNLKIDDILKVIDTLGNLPFEYVVDNVRSYQDLLQEDKWLVYKRLAAFMPPTAKLKSFSQVNFNKQLVKLRLSSRSQGIFLSRRNLPPSANPADYIVQPVLSPASPEYRVFMIGGEIIQPLGLRSPKSHHQKSHLLGTIENSDLRLIDFCRRIQAVLDYDFVGLDVIYSNGRYYLIDVNRSCQFKAYFRLTGINLAARLLNHIYDQTTSFMMAM